MQTVINVDILVVLIIVVATAAVFAASLSAVVYGINKSSHEFYSKREDESDAKIAQLEAKVEQLEGQVSTLMQLLGNDGPKGYAVAP